MNCFFHPDRPALGLCKSCGRGLCPDCLAEVPDGLACKNRCEERVLLLNRMIDSNRQVLAVSNVHVRSGMVFTLAFGVLFCLFGFVPFFVYGQKGALFLGVMGVVFLVSGLLRLRPKARFPELK
jgi:hypothetical protein